MKTRYIPIALLGIGLCASKCADDVAEKFPISLPFSKSFTIKSATTTGSETVVLDLSTEKDYQDNKSKLSAIEIDEIRISSATVLDTTIVCEYVLLEAKDQGTTFAVTDTLRNVALQGLKDRILPSTAAKLNKLGSALKNATTPVEVYYRYKFSKPATGTVLKSDFKLKLKLS